MSDRNFSPEKILFLELGLSWDNNPIYTRICEVDYISEKNFKDILTNILTSNIYPQPNCFPIFDNTQSQARKLTETSLRCTGYDTEIILYIPSQLGVFETKKAPISHFKPQLIDNPRIFYRDNNIAEQKRKIHGQTALIFPLMQRDILRQCFRAVGTLVIPAATPAVRFLSARCIPSPKSSLSPVRATPHEPGPCFTLRTGTRALMIRRRSP